MAAIHNILASPKLHVLALSQSQPPSLDKALPCCFSSSKNKKKKRLVIKCQAADSSSQTLYQGIYGPWSVDSDDVRECSLLGFSSLAATAVQSCSSWPLLCSVQNCYALCGCDPVELLCSCGLEEFDN